MHTSNLYKLLKTGVTVYSSGTTDKPKPIFRSPNNLKLCINIALQSQAINRSSSIYTVTSLKHAGGLIAQTLPAVYCGASIHIEKFNAFRFLRKFKQYTHTFLPPQYMEVITRTKSFTDYNFAGRWILTGSDAVDLDICEAFVSRNAIVLANWGMSEIGPIVINYLFRNITDIQKVRKVAPLSSTVLGNTFYTKYKIINGELYVNSPLCIYKGWFATGDKVTVADDTMFYLGRKK